MNVWILKIYYEICPMIKTKHSNFFTYLLLVVFIITSIQCVSTISYTAHEINTSAVLSKLLNNSFQLQHSESSGTSSERNIFLAVEEELEENEEITGKYNFSVLTFADFSRALHLRKINNHFFIYQPSNGSVFSIPLHKRNCVYLI